MTVIIVILAGGQLVGIFGMLLAVPTASIIKDYGSGTALGIKELQDTLGEPSTCSIESHTIRTN